MVQPTFYGSQRLTQQHQTFLPEGVGGGANFMTSVSEYQLVQNGGDSGRHLAFDDTFRYHRNGRDLAAYTHVDVLYQGYFVAFLALAGLGQRRTRVIHISVRRPKKHSAPLAGQTLQPRSQKWPHALSKRPGITSGSKTCGCGRKNMERVRAGAENQQ